ncbi:uncharacterized protein EV420DRAFT_1682069 [Desarmillaria tabescens]|uniref:DUF6534 domain-containing protein n=1 Tax=Armillaria tabescens TaxID=1929756 RepID=A0AA39KCB0_ARMTA|nr:uncharacterized protein EV420DRAFT_1682069 [Desarmillaria tabescens]KAK0458168.1 hypothetical protein EV420DRAFT_1682069 [Desarmillaria tabescens]
MSEGSLDSTFGAFLIGAIVSACLFGITCTQTWYYYGHYSDSIFIKALVGIVWTLEAVHAAFACHAAYYYVVTQYGNVAGLSEATWSTSLTLCVTGLITLAVHLFYARQLYFVSNRNILLVSALLFLALGQHLACSAAVAGYRLVLNVHFNIVYLTDVFSMKLRYYDLFETQTMTSLLKAAMCFYLATDFLVAASLCYYLHASRPIHFSTDNLINRLMIYTINNGLLTGVTDLLVIAFNIAYPSNLVYLSVYQVVANLYSNSFLATLNARKPTKMTYIDNFSCEDNSAVINNLGANMSPLRDPSNIVQHCPLSLVLEPTDWLLGQPHIDIHITTTTDTIRDAGSSSPEFEPKPMSL